MRRPTLGIVAAIGLACRLAAAAPVPENIAPVPGAARPEYRANIEDVLEVSVLRPDKIDATVTVGPDGTISFPYIGNVYVKGMSLAGIQQEVQKRLSDGYMRYPEVAVTLKESRVNKFFISGEVAHPGAYPIEDNTTVLKAISIAGGFTQSGLHGHAKVIRPKNNGSGYEVYRVAIRGVEQASDADSLTLKPGDTVVVSEDKFFAYGEVAKPGTYPLEENTSVLKAISIAGGFTQFGAYSRVKVLRPLKDGGHQVIKINVKGLMNGDPGQSDVVLQPDDTVVVSEDKFFVYGEVNKPGTYPIEEDTTVMKAISIAGGFSKFGSASRVKVLRPRKSGTGYDTIKVNLKGVMEGSAKDQDNILQPGDTVVVSEGVF